MSVWLPPKVSRELAEESRRREAAALDAVDLAAREEWVRVFNAQLERVVPGMFLAGCPDPAPLDLVGQGARPGYWHLIWPGFNGGPLNIMPLQGPGGERREPGSWVFDLLAEGDLWNERSNRERARVKRAAEEASARRLEQERRDRDEEVMERYLAATRAQVSMSRDVPWSQNSNGRRGARQ